jgi:uncharacterized protein
MSFFNTLLLSAAIAFSAWSLADGLRELRTGDRYVTVKGLAEIEVPADLVIWPLSFVEAADDLAVLYDTLARNTEQVRQFLREQGLADAEVSSSPPRIQDARAEAYGDANANRFRYRAETTLTIRSTDTAGVKKALENAGELLRRGVVFTAYGPPPEYLFTGLNALKPQLIAEATAAARTAAEQFAQDAQSEVGSIRSANQGVITISDRDAGTPEIKTVRVVSTVEYRLE